MIRVLRNGDADPKLRRVATPCGDLRRTRRGDDRAVASAPILLADVMLDLIRELPVVIRSDVSVWPVISLSSPPQAGHGRSSAASS
jgi:hypothetical protein